MSTQLSLESLSGLDYEKGCWPTLHKLDGSWSRSPDELEAG